VGHFSRADPGHFSRASKIKAFVDVIKERTTRPVLWIDEADHLPVATLTELRSLSEFDPRPSRC
jgi:DNA transposition AAA+ family ATPase